MDYHLLIPQRPQKVLKTTEITCAGCGKKFTVPFWMIKKGRRFCRVECRKKDPLQTLMSRIQKDENGCWNYTGWIGWGGYGELKVGHTNWLAHRLMWILHNKKPIPDGMVIRHTCIGNRRCINPDHLSLGTQSENVHDAIKQGRFRISVGVERSFAYLTMAKVEAIRALRPMGLSRSESKHTYAELGEMFGVSSGIIWQVVNFKTYKGKLEIKKIC